MTKTMTAQVQLPIIIRISLWLQIWKVWLCHTQLYIRDMQVMQDQPWHNFNWDNKVALMVIVDTLRIGTSHTWIYQISQISWFSSGFLLVDSKISYNLIDFHKSFEIYLAEVFQRMPWKETAGKFHNWFTSYGYADLTSQFPLKMRII